MQDIADRKRQDRAVWAAGDYDAIAELIWAVGGRLVRRLEVTEGEDVLDVACGTGNAAIPAAAAGGRVTGLDLTPELFAAGRERAATAGAQVEWVEGDAEALPFQDACFDVVLSTFGCMFAPRQEVVAAELVRVLRPGGRLGLCSWTADGAVGGFLRVIAGHLPPPPEPPSPPTRWGTEDGAKQLLGGTGVELEFAREEVVFHSESAAHYVDMYARKFGPVLAARRALEPEGRWEPLRDDLIALFQGVNESRDGRLEWRGEYLVAVGRKPVAGS
jgi:ubiquinone/menaquinone biosynthesis C-methylase UbiE